MRKLLIAAWTVLALDVAFIAIGMAYLLSPMNAAPGGVIPEIRSPWSIWFLAGFLSKAFAQWSAVVALVLLVSSWQRASAGLWISLLLGAVPLSVIGCWSILALIR